MTHAPGFVPAAAQAMLTSRAAPSRPVGTPVTFALPELGQRIRSPEREAEEAARAAAAAEAAARQAALDAAHAAGWAEGEAAGRVAAAAEHRAARETAEAAALAAAAEALGRIAGTAAATIDQASGSLARLLLGALDAALPAAAARLAPETAARLVHLMRPVLEQAGHLRLAVAPGLSHPVAARLADARVSVVEDAALAPGDAHATWQDGRADSVLAARRAAVAALLESLDLAHDPVEGAAAA